MSEARGVSLERHFATWMKTELGYSETRLRQPVKGKIADRAYEVDVHAVQYNRVAEYLWRAGIVVLVAAIAMYLLPHEFARQRSFLETLVTALDPKLAGNSLLILGAAAMVVGWIAKQRITKHAWVECKDMKGNVKRAHVQKLAASIEDVRAFQAAKWHPDVVILVAGSDFDSDALAFAEKHGFLCFRRVGDGYERVEESVAT